MGRRRRQRTGFGRSSADHDDLPSVAWTVIRCYPIARRPEHVAAGLLQEIEYRTFRLPHRRATQFVPTPIERLDRTFVDDEPPVEAVLTVERLLGQARVHGLDERSIELVRRLAGGASTAALAAELQVTTRTVRNRRDRAIEVLRALPAAVAC
jgi:DNA-binding CsgD family transcriptional regulator